MNKTQEMSTFVAVVEAGSFVGAMDALGSSKPAISRHISDLEQRLGVRLLQRTTRRLSLTSEGQAFYQRCKEILTLIQESESEIASRTAEPSGLLRVNAPLTFGVLHLAALWGQFADLHPRVTFDITLSDRVVDLVDEGYDLAVRIGALPDSLLVSRQLARTRMLLCASPDYLLRHGTPQHPRDLLGHQVISYSYWSRRDEWQFSGPEGEVTVKTQPRIHANNGDTCRAAALQHQGVILQPSFLVANDLQQGTLVELLPGYRAIELGIYAVYPTRKHLPLKVRRLVDFLVEAFRHPPWEETSQSHASVTPMAPLLPEGK